MTADFLKVNFATSVRKNTDRTILKLYKIRFFIFLKNRVSDLIKNLINETLIYSDKYIFAILNIFTDCLTLILLTSFLLFYNPLATSIVIFIIIILVFIYFKFSSVKIRKLSSQRQMMRENYLKCIMRV